MNLSGIRTFRWWLVSSVCARGPVSMAPLALVLAGRDATGSFASGALLAGVCGITQGLGAPWRGKLLDRPHRSHALAVELAGSGASFAALTAAIVVGAPEVVLVLLAGLGGVFAAAIPGGYLARLPAAVPEEALPRALTATAVAIEVSWVIGPLLVTGTALVAPPVYALALVSGLLFVALVTEIQLPERAWPALVESAESPWRDTRARRTYALAGIVALGFGVVDTTMPALLGKVGLEPALAGLLTGIPAGASVISGSYLLARRTDLSGQGTAAAARLGMFAGVTLLPLALMSSFAGFAVVLGVAGIWMSPMNAVWSHVLHDALPNARRAEGFTLLHASLRLGIGCGAAVSAVLLPYIGPATLVSTAGLVPLLGCGAVLVRTRLDRAPV